MIESIKMTDSYREPKPNKTYVSSSLRDFRDDNRRVRIVSKVIESKDSYAFSQIKDETIIRHKENAKTYIKATFFEESRDLTVLNIQGYSVATDKPHNASFSFVGEEIGKLYEFIKNIKRIPLDSNAPINITDEELRSTILSNQQAINLLKDNEELFLEVIRSSLTKKDIVAIAYRKKQLDIFGSLLNNPEFFESCKQKMNCGDEKVWQRFFEKNPWIFGYSLNYIYLSSFNDTKLEQVVAGYDIATHGKRVDALMKSKGFISNLCFIEIKTHRTALLHNDPYRAGCWRPSNELAGAVAQVQGTVASAIEQIGNKITITDPKGFPTGENVFNYLPKSYLIIGNLSELVNEHGINQEQYRSLELYRKNTNNPEIITFDELYERAKFIVHNAEVQDKS